MSDLGNIHSVIAAAQIGSSVSQRQQLKHKQIRYNDYKKAKFHIKLTIDNKGWKIIQVRIDIFAMKKIKSNTRANLLQQYCWPEGYNDILLQIGVMSHVIYPMGKYTEIISIHLL